LTYPTGEIVFTTFSSAGYPLSMAAPGATIYVASASYNSLGLASVTNFGNGLATRYLYHGQVGEWPITVWPNRDWGRLAQICVFVSTAGCGSWDSSANVRLNRIYLYDGVGNVTNTDDLMASLSLAMTYDHVDRLQSVRPQWGANSYVEDYRYDQLGNLTYSTRLGEMQYTATVNGRRLPHALNRITGPMGSGDVAQYDANGNMTQRWDGVRWFGQEWDAENRLVRMWDLSNPTQEVRYGFDADGVLVKKTKPNGSWTVYLGPHAEVGSTGATSHYWFNGQRIGRRDSSGMYWIHADHLGSASVATGTNGQVIASQRYKPYGETYIPNGVLPTDRRFTGQREEADFGIYDYGARFYSPLLGRFLSADTIVPEPGNLQALNRYSYALGNPMKFVDPTGHAHACPESATRCGLDGHTRLIDLKRLGARPGKNIAPLLYLFYKDPTKFSFTASVEFFGIQGPDQKSAVNGVQVSQFGATVFGIFGQGGIAAYDRPGKENYPVQTEIYEDTDGKRHFDRLLVVGDRQVPLFVGTFDIATLSTGAEGIVETLPLGGGMNAILHLEVIFGGGPLGSIIMRSSSIELSPSMSVPARLVLPSTTDFFIQFKTVQLDATHIQTIGGVFVSAPWMSSPQPMGLVTFNGTYTP
jgi:RHS repeat-associated protein